MLPARNGPEPAWRRWFEVGWPPAAPKASLKRGGRYVSTVTQARPFDMSLVQRGARLRRSPFFEATQRYGPKGFTVYNHTLFPTNFDDFEAEYRHLLEHVTVWDVAVERNVEITGPDGFRFAQLLTCRDLSTCAVGQGKYVLVTAPDGDPVQIQGPKSKDVVGDLFGREILDLRYYWFGRTEVDGIPVIVTRTGWTSEVGYEVYLLDGSRGVDLWDRIMDAGRPYDIRPTGPSDIRRIEGGIFNWGADMTTENNPFELGLDRLVDLDIELPFMGKEALRRIREEGVSRKIVGVEIAGDRLEMNATKWPVLNDGETVGAVTSAIWSPRLEKNIGYAWVPVGLSDEGTALRVKTAAGDRDTAVVSMPFVDPGKQIPRS